MELRAEHFAGPLPPPAVLQEYDQVLPGLAERIVTLAEKQSAHRQALEKGVVEANIRNEARGQHYGLIIGLVIGVGALVLIGLGHSGIGLSIVIAELAAFVGVFIYGKRQQRKELVEKRTELMREK